MNNERALAVVENYKIRRMYDEASETWYFSVVDIVAALIQQSDYQTARKYWNKLKERLKKEGSQSVTDCHQLKLEAADGKKYLTDVASPETLLPAGPGHLATGLSRQKASKIVLPVNWLHRSAHARATPASPTSGQSLDTNRTWSADCRTRMGSSGLDFDNMPEDQKRVINNLPAMLYHGLPRRSSPAKPGLPRRCGPQKPGVPRRSFRAKAGVNTEAAVLMRMIAVPRSIATGLGEKYAEEAKESVDLHSVHAARSYLRALSPNDWQRCVPSNARMTGEDYRDIWRLLAGERD